MRTAVALGRHGFRIFSRYTWLATPMGVRAAQSHTAVLSSNDRSYDDVLRHSGKHSPWKLRSAAYPRCGYDGG